MGDSVSLLREPDAGNPPVRFDERDVETEHGEASEAPADARAGNDRPHLNHRATSRLYPLNTNWYFSIVLEITRPSTLKLHKPLGQCLIDMECYPIALV